MKKTIITSAIIVVVFVSLYFIQQKYFPTLFYSPQRIAKQHNDDTNKVIQFLRDAGVYYIATVDNDNQPRVRPFSSVLNIDGKLSVCTGAGKNVYQQVIENPKVELATGAPDGRYIRVTGTLFDNTTEQNQQIFFDAMPILSELYKDKEGDLRVLSFQTFSATISDLTGDKLEIIEVP